MTTTYTNGRIFDGIRLHDGMAIRIKDGVFAGMIPQQDATNGIDLAGDILSLGYVDLQVNGGDGIMFNDDPSTATLTRIAQAHRRLGVTRILPTLITDTVEKTRAAIEATIHSRDVGIAGLHLEGPHLSLARKGAHDATLIRPMEAQDLELICDAARRLPNVMVTVAPENVTTAQINAMSAAGVIVSLGHTDASFDACISAFDAGATCVTHLFNAMSQLGSRSPGLVGATLARGDIYAGLIADGVHVHPTTIAAALRAKVEAQKLFLVSDAMATAGSDIRSFKLNDREVLRDSGRLTLADGTLAGADLELTRAVDVMTGDVGEDISRAISRATSGPAGLLRQANGLGSFDDGAKMALYFKEGFSKPFQILEK